MIDLSSIINKFSELFTTFVGLPIEYQVAIGIGGLVVLAATKNIWGLLKPIRWIAATLLRSVAFVCHPNTRQKRQKRQEEDVPFDVSTKETYIRTCKTYANKKNISSLPNEQLDMLEAAGDLYALKVYWGSNPTPFFERPWRRERRERNLKRQVANSIKGVQAKHRRTLAC